MGFVLLALIITFAIHGLMNAARPQSGVSEPTIVPCPPHKWKAQETKDQEGNVVSWKLVCEDCGPMVSE